MAYSKVHRGGFGCRAEWRACRRTDSKQRGRPRESGALVLARLDRILSADWRPFFSRRRPPGRRIGRKRFALVPAGNARERHGEAFEWRLGRGGPSRGARMGGGLGVSRGGHAEGGGRRGQGRWEINSRKFDTRN